MMDFIQADISHLDFLVQLEYDNFPVNKRASKRSIKNSILSKNQLVIIAVDDNINVGSATLFLYKRTVRFYSLAVAKGLKGKGYGTSIIDYVITYAKSRNFDKLILEADYANDRLVALYKKIGFKLDKVLHDYYGEGEDGCKMSMNLEVYPGNIVVTDYATDFFNGMSNVNCIRAKQYIEDQTYQEMKNIRVFNFCRSFQYQSVGYYVSLLALARNHKVYPSSATLRDFRSKVILKSIGEEAHDLIQESLKGIKESKFILDSFFGFPENKKNRLLLDTINTLFESPLIRYEFRKNINWELYKATPLTLNDVKCIKGIRAKAEHYFSQTRFNPGILKNYEYDLAILIDETEENPPSDKIALSHFKKAAEKYGFYVEFITKKDYRRLPEFDALFIRVTTNVNDYTYDFSRYAYSEGLVVIDDPWSILGCSNKLFLYEKMLLNGVKMPATWLLSKKSNYSDALENLTYPIILKQPDSAFSKGVHKAANRAQLDKLLEKLYKTSELIVAQQYTPSAYDWRIGVLNRKPLFACKYFMAKGHWQVYNWEASKENSEGDFETLPIEAVPAQVINTAVKAAALMGDGLYGVDLKEIDGEVYLIEVNDNPNVDAGIEDRVMGTELYESIIALMLERIENYRNVDRFLSS